MTQRVLGAGLLALLALFATTAQGQKLNLVAAENVYGDVARQIGGDRINVVSILGNPAQDPHLFEMTSTTIRLVSEAQIVIFNGANYDPWMKKLLAATPRAMRIVVNAAELVGTKPGDNPHLWYSLPAMHAVANAIADAYRASDSTRLTDYTACEKAFASSLSVVAARIEQSRARHGGLAITATEPVFGYMASALGLEMRNQRFQLAVMNDTEPSARDIAAFERDLKEHNVRLLLFNKQASTELTRRMVEIARRSKIPAIGVTESLPPNMNYQGWMLMQLDEVEKALDTPSP